MLCAGIEHKGSTQQAAGSTHFCRESGGAFYAVRFRGKAWSSQRNRSLAKRDPEGTFEKPFVIVDETMFTRGEKIATLDRWRQSILAELTAVGEVKRARLLGEIQEARNRLHR